MPALPSIPSFIKPKPAKWRSRVSNRTPFSTGRLIDNISSPHPYAAPDVLDIQDITASFGSVTPPPPPLPDKHPTHDSPQITLDLNVNLSTGDFDSDWIENQFAATPVSHYQLDRNRMAVYESRAYAPMSAPRWEPRGVPTEVPIDDDDDDIDLSTSEDDVVKSLEAMDASTFLHLPPQRNQMTEQDMSSLARRNPPAPIRIPSLSMHGPQVQIVRSAGQNSRPLSEVSTAESSAVSGQTLARALLGNSFVLSNDNRGSRYKSGLGGGLVRSDSATLPRGDHPLMNSPFWRDRTLSGTSETFAAHHLAPPIPPNAEKVYVPPQTPRQAAAGVEPKRRTLRRHSSTGSLSSPTSGGGGFSESKSRPNSIGEFTREIEKIEKDLLRIRSISRISEAPSVVSTTAANPDISSHTPSSDQSPTIISPGTAELFPSPPSVDPPSVSPAASSSTTKSPLTSSTPASSSSTRFSGDNILDYYSSPDTPEPGRPFAPVVSPIIEETSSQLSSPASRRLSQRPTSRTISPLSGTINGRIDLNVVRRPSDGTVISSNPRRISAQMTTPNADDKGATTTTTSQRISLVPPPPISRVMGGRLRSGSAPSPIKITRDSRDLNAYNIISPLPENTAETPSTGGSNEMEVQQTFPETPNAFSPFWSPGTSSPGMMTQGLPDGYDVPPMPRTPKSAAMVMMHGRDPPRGLGQQLLARSATMRQMTHANQHGMLRRELSEPQPPPSTSIPPDPAKSGEDDEEAEYDTEEGMGQDIEALPSVPSEVSPVSSASQYSDASGGPHSARQEIGRDFISMGAVIEARPESPATSLNSSPRLGYLTQTSPPVTSFPPDHAAPSYHFTGFTNPFDPYAPPTRPDHRTFVSPLVPSLRTPPPPPVVITPPAGDTTSVPSPYPNRSLRRISEISQNLESPPAYEEIHHDQPPSITPTSGNSSIEPQFGAASAQHSPPATHDSSNEYLPLTRRTSNGNRDRRGRMRPTGPRRPLSHVPHALPITGRARNPSISSVVSTGQNTPTPPSKSSSTTPVVEPKSFPNNNPLNSDGQPGYSPPPNATLAVNNPPITHSPKSPNFQVPPTPYRGLTMDQAKWTFTSAQLQTIVSRAIRQTAEASSIRLLRLEVLDNDIPRELNELDARKSEIKSRYRLLTRTSGSLFLKLEDQIASGSPDAQRTLEELRDVTRQLNKLTEELHSVDQQQAQIQSLVQSHSSSALRMALRKLNTSFLKQLSQTQALERQVADLADEIWTLNEVRSMKASAEHQHPSRTQSFRIEQPQSQSPPATVQNSPSQVAFPGSIPSERATSWGSESGGGGGGGGRKSTLTHAKTITRKPSLSYSMSIRSAGNRLSQRSSLSSTRTSMMSGGPSSAWGVPPVPPLPRRRPTDIITDAPTRSTTMFSTDGTPGTEVRAMMRAQDELYRMLGMSLQNDTRLRRSHSVIGLPGNPEAQLHPSINPNNLLQPSATGLSRSESLDSGPFSNRAHTRHQSYPASLLEAYNPLDADRTAMLATLEMISQDDR